MKGERQDRGSVGHGDGERLFEALGAGHDLTEWIDDPRNPGVRRADDGHAVLYRTQGGMSEVLAGGGTRAQPGVVAQNDQHVGTGPSQRSGELWEGQLEADDGTEQAERTF